MNLGNDRWHTFAVEVTKSHISWFVDAHVINTERRAEALSGGPAPPSGSRWSASPGSG